MKYYVAALLALQLMSEKLGGADAFAILPSAIHSSNTQTTSTRSSSVPTTLHGKKQSRSTLLKPSREETKPKEEKKEEEVYGAKFFGGNAIKEELFDEKLEEQADQVQRLYPKKTVEAGADADADELVYNRFMDTDAFDEASRSLAQRLQTAINQALYEDEDGAGSALSSSIYSANLQWNTPVSRAKDSKNPLNELTNALDFYKRVDCAIVSAKTLAGNDESASVKRTEVRWEISVMWPNFFESRVLITGTSTLTVDVATETILSQTDSLDMGGKDGKDIIKTISPQIQPRFWDLYHIGMTPSAETMTRAEPTKAKGSFSSYELFEIPPRLVLQPSMVDDGGRAARNAEALPNHAFSTIIKTTGPYQQRYVPTSPVEVSIRREPGTDGGEKSIISWNIGLPPEFVSYYDELPIGNDDDDDDEDEGSKCEYSYQSRRLVATLPYGGSAQDSEVSDIRKKLYEQVMKDGLKPKLVDGRPQFFFLDNDAKACFTADGGLGMAVYEWRPDFSKSNEVGIELEL